MKPVVTLACAAVAIFCSMPLAASPGIHVTGGSAYFEDAVGNREPLAGGAGDGRPTLSPDRTRLAWTRAASSDDDATSLWLFDAGSRHRRVLYQSDDSWIEGMPIFSLDGGYVYINTGAAGPGCRIHQIGIATGREKTVTGGGCLASILRNGPYRGYLIVARHLYRDTPPGGSYDIDYVVRPDGVDQFAIPGTEDENRPHVRESWLKSKGWMAW